MKQEQILKKAIEKAGMMSKTMIGDKGRDCRFENYSKYDWECLIDFGYYELIFSHDFAKAFWGEEDEYSKSKDGIIGSRYLGIAWEYHLQQMVLEEDKIKYLSKFI